MLSTRLESVENFILHQNSLPPGGRLDDIHQIVKFACSDLKSIDLQGILENLF